MFKQIVLPILGVIAFITIVGLFARKTGTINIPGSVPSTVSNTKVITVNSSKINVEIASDKESRTKGLSGRSTLGESNGMLFVFESKDVTPIFWMKDMEIPLDIIWINDGKVVKIDKNIQAPKNGTPDNQLATYSPGQPIDYVLEVNSGFSDKNNIQVGSTVDTTAL